MDTTTYTTRVTPVGNPCFRLLKIMLPTSEFLATDFNVASSLSIKNHKYLYDLYSTDIQYFYLYTVRLK